MTKPNTKEQPMTVLERLKELEAKATKASENGGPQFALNIEHVCVAMDALPHLIAVAEAAKEVAYVRRCPCCKSNRVHDQYCTLSKDVPRLYDEITEEWERVVPLIDALAALTKETPDAG